MKTATLILAGLVVIGFLSVSVVDGQASTRAATFPNCPEMGFPGLPGPNGVRCECTTTQPALDNACKWVPNTGCDIMGNPCIVKFTSSDPLANENDVQACCEMFINGNGFSCQWTGNTCDWK